MTTPRVTLRDVARRAGVSPTTASFAMAGRRDMRISAAAEQRVLQAARELNYRPNLLARSLRTRRLQTFGLISDMITTEAFAGELARGSMGTALLNEHLMLIGETQGDPGIEKRLVEDMLDRGVDGFVYATMFTRRASIPAALQGHPLVLVNCVVRGRKVPMVVPDEEGAGRTAAEVLLKAGHRDGIVLVGERPSYLIAAQARLNGIQSEFHAAGTSLASEIDCLWWPQPARVAVARYLAQNGRPRALICLNDRIALGAYQALGAAGLRVPDDVSVVSFDDSDLASWLEPQLTSVSIPHFELGRRAVELLIDPDRENGVHRIPMPLSERASVGPPAS